VPVDRLRRCVLGLAGGHRWPAVFDGADTRSAGEAPGAWKPTSRWLLSQNGLSFEWPHRHRAARGSRFEVPSSRRTTTSPRTANGPFSTGVTVGTRAPARLVFVQPGVAQSTGGAAFDDGCDLIAVCVVGQHPWSSVPVEDHRKPAHARRCMDAQCCVEAHLDVGAAVGSSTHGQVLLVRTAQA
jgi:hypothetical protein